MAKKYRTDEIPHGNFDEDWGGSAQNTNPSAADETNLLPYSGAAVQKFIKDYLKDHETGKVGYVQQPMEKVQGYYRLRGFANLQAYQDWSSDRENPELQPIVDVPIPISDEQGVMNIVELSTASNQTNLVSIDGTVVLKMRFTSQTYNPVNQKYADTFEDGVMTIQRRASSADQWRTIGTVPIKSIEANSEGYADVDISNLLNSGTCQLRVIVVGDQSQMSTTYVVFQSVTKTELKLNFRNEWNLPITGQSMQLFYTYEGAVAKHLYLEISGVGGTREWNTALGRGEASETPAQFDLTDTQSDTVKIMSHGVHEIRAWLQVDGTDIRSEVVTSQVMVVSPTATDEELDAAYLILNEVKPSLVNWTSAQFFKWCIYHRNRETLPVTFQMTDITGNANYLEYTEARARIGEIYSFSNMIEINSNQTAFTTYMLFKSGETYLRSRLAMNVDNSQNFAPIEGADLIINPKLRSNNEENPDRIINTVTGLPIPAVFRNFGFVSDGWVEDSDGIKCLRVPSGRSLDIDYEVLSDFIQARKTGSLTFEIDFSVNNVSNDDEPVLKMCSYTDDENPLGWEMKPTESCFMTQNKVVRKNQDVGYQEGVRTKIAVNLLYNLSASGQNYCRIFVNGVINREFNYATDDTFVQYVNGVQTSQGIRIGSTSADIDIYSIKVYKKAMTAADIRQNYMASLDNSEDKIRFRDANDILNGNLISYDLAYDKYNVILWKGRYAKYGNTKNDVFPGDLVIHIQGDPAHSGTLYNMNEKGQGTSSMTYFWWNGDWRFQSTGYWVDENGVDHGAAYQLMDGVPMATKLVGKVNFASSMQSHKIGSTALYNDLWKAVCGGNSVTSKPGYEGTRSAVIEKPFLFFIQENENSEPQFASFITFGPGKGDKPTFGYDKDVFPDYICIEGADNDRDLVMGRVPWIDGDVILDGEDWKYRGQKQFSLVFGNLAKVAPFKAAWNFIFQYFDNIDYFEGNANDLNAWGDADTNKHYWCTAVGPSNSQYDLYRYDFLTSKWVAAGLTKIGEGQYSSVNINTQCGNIASGTDWIAINDRFKEKRTQLFKQNVETYFNKTEIMFHMNFTKFIAASDNRGKNTYFYVDPTTHKIGCHQDDLDTIFDINNVGQKEKPYYVEEHDRIPANNNPYWNSEANSLFNQMENAYPLDLRTNMRAILQAMASLSEDGTILGCFEKYYFYVQRYFPAVAYNEVARLLYEKARLAYISTGDDKYTNGTDPITQSLGDKLQAEIQWVKMRIAYMSSYAGYGDFGRRDGEGSAGSLNFRSIAKVDSTNPSYRFSIVPHIWMYPTFAIGSTLLYGANNTVAPRIQAGELYEVNIGTSDGNTNIFLNGIDYMRDIGGFADKSLGETFNLSGARLTEFHVNNEIDNNNDGVVDCYSDMQFRPTGMTVTAALLQVLELKNVSTLVGGLDLSLIKKLRKLVLTGTSLTSVTFPATEYLEEIYLPGTLTALELDEQPNLTRIEMEGASRLQRLSLGSGVKDSRAIFNLCFTGNAPLNYVKMSEISWGGEGDERGPISLYMANYLAGITDVSVTGEIHVINNTTNRPTFADKIEWLHKWGNVDDANNPLRISYYPTASASIEIKGSQYIYEVGEHKFYCKPNTPNDNDVVRIEWTLDANMYSSIDTAKTQKDYCVVNVHTLGDEDTLAPTTMLRCRMYKSDGTYLDATWQIGLYPRRAHLGDYVFYDGTYGPTQAGKTVVGICFYINPNDPTDRRMVSLANQGSYAWGLQCLTSNGDSWNESYAIGGIELQDDAVYNVYDLASIVNFTGTGLAATGAINHSANYIEFENYVNEDNPDGFVNTGANTGAGDGIAGVNNNNTGRDILTAELALLSGFYKNGDEVPTGMVKTLKIIQHRNKILEDSGVGLQIPRATSNASEDAELTRLLSEIQAANGGKEKYRQYYYPAASKAYAYQPTVKADEVLDDKFRVHNWYLPSIGELCRLYWHSKKGPNYNDDKIGPIFQRAIAANMFTDFSASSYWSSSEYSQYYAWYVDFSNGYFVNYLKTGTNVVRAVAAF